MQLTEEEVTVWSPAHCASAAILYVACFRHAMSFQAVQSSRATWGLPLRSLSMCCRFEQARRWQSLQQRIQQPYDSENSRHQDMLRLLWSHAFPGEACTSLVDPRWTDMGWQQRDPSTDFRGAGLIALENLIYLAQVITQLPVWSVLCT